MRTREVTFFPGLAAGKERRVSKPQRKGETLNIELRTLNGAMTENIR